MLVLTRSEGQSIVIGDEIVVTVLRLQCGTVRIGIQAPADTVVQRKDTGRLEQAL